MQVRSARWGGRKQAPTEVVMIGIGGRTADVVVVGAGPAGCRAAERLARRGCAVALCDPRAPWEKPCGGGLTAAALRHTPELHELRPEGHPVHELQVVAPSGLDVVVPLRRPYLVVNRFALARWGLARVAVAGARFRRTGIAVARHEEGGWVLTDADGTDHRCRWLVVADGAASRLRRVVAPNVVPGRYAARVAFPRRGVAAGRAVLRFLPAVEGYAWDFPRTGHHSVGVMVPAGSMRRPELDRIIGEVRALSDGTDPSPHAGAVITAWDWSAGQMGDLGGSGYAVLGDAAGLADPVTGEGIDYAMVSAACATDGFEDVTGFSAYPPALDRLLAPDRARARAVRRWFYRPTIVEGLVRAARASSAGRDLLAALADAVNEHEPIGRSLRHAAGAACRS